MVKNLPANEGDAGDTGSVSPSVGKIPWRRKWQPTPIFLPGKYHGQRSLVGYSPGDREELDTTETTKHICLHEVYRVGGYIGRKTG